MRLRQVVITPNDKAGAFSSLTMPDGSRAVVLNQQTHERALRAADQTISDAIKKLRGGDDAEQRNDKTRELVSAP